jgi:2-hydroxy-3-oxopropionate reductase
MPFREHTMKIGFVGLGNIGGAIAKNVLAAHNDLAVYDHVPERSDSLVAAGAARCASTTEVARCSEITFFSLPTPDVVDAEATAWLHGAPRGSILVDLSTNSPHRIQTLGERVRARGCELLDAPLTGGAYGAARARLVFMVGGDAKAFERVRPVLARLGRATFYMGNLGLGSTAKLVNSLIAFSTTLASLEAFALSTKAGIDLRKMVDVVRAGGAGNFFTDRGVETIGMRDGAQFTLDLAAKDARLIVELADSVGVPLPLAEQVAELFETAVGGGMGARDWMALPEWYEREGELEYRLTPPAKT